MHDVHVLHGTKFTAFGQRKAFAKIRAEEVFPVPRGPVNNKACGKRPFFKAFERVWVI
jgi:hypothetical protein